MTARRALVVMAAVSALLGWAPAAAAQSAPPPPAAGEVTVAQLLADSAAYDGERVVVRGELVGDFGRRGDGTVWAQLNGDAYAEAPLLEGGSLAGANQGIGVRIPADLWPGFDRPGGYRTRGPLVELTGVWRYHDPGRGGETYLDVAGLELQEGPRELREGAAWLPLGVGAGLLAVAGAVLLVGRRRR